MADKSQVCKIARVLIAILRYIHNLEKLAKISDIPVTEEQKERLKRITRFHLDARYPDEKRTFRKTCTEEFTEKELAVIEEVYTWLKSMLQ